jgi:hypothetical protein
MSNDEEPSEPIPESPYRLRDSDAGLNLAALDAYEAGTASVAETARRLGGRANANDVFRLMKALGRTIPTPPKAEIDAQVERFLRAFPPRPRK